MEIAWASARSHCRPAVIHAGPLRTIPSRCVFVLHLLVPLFEVVFVLSDSFAFVFPHLNTMRPTVEADAIHVVHHHRPVVVVVNHRHVDVGHGAIVDKLSPAPFAAPETHAGVAVPVINSAVEPDVWSPVAAMPNVNAFRKAPISGSPK